MRDYPEDEDDEKWLLKLNAEPWMVECLRQNPDYNGWGPGDDAMCDNYTVATWSDFDSKLNDLNECVNFHFTVERASEPCSDCSQSGFNPETVVIADNFYNGTCWRDKITQDEVDILVAKHRLNGLAGITFNCETNSYSDPTLKVTAEQINAANRRGAGWSDGSHDAINRHILIKARAKFLGVWGLCPTCSGEGSVFTELGARLGLAVWMIYPRKGHSQGVEITNITREDLPEVLTWLTKAADRNAQRFSKIRT